MSIENKRPPVPGPVAPVEALAAADAAANARRDDSLGGLLKSLTHDLSTLFTTEMALAKSEFREAVNEAKVGIGGMAVGAGLALAGLIVLLFAAVYGIANWLPLWVSALIVGAAAMVVGLGMAKGAQSKLDAQAFVPSRTTAELHKDRELAKRKVQ